MSTVWLNRVEAGSRELRSRSGWKRVRWSRLSMHMLVPVWVWGKGALWFMEMLLDWSACEEMITT